MCAKKQTRAALILQNQKNVPLRDNDETPEENGLEDKGQESPALTEQIHNFNADQKPDGTIQDSEKKKTPPETPLILASDSKPGDEMELGSGSTRGRKPRNKVEEFEMSIENTRKFAHGGSPNNIWLDVKTRGRAEAIKEALGLDGDKDSSLRLSVAVAINFLWENHSNEIMRRRDQARNKKNENLD